MEPLKAPKYMKCGCAPSDGSPCCCPSSHSCSPPTSVPVVKEVDEGRCGRCLTVGCWFLVANLCSECNPLGWMSNRSISYDVGVRFNQMLDVVV